MHNSCVFFNLEVLCAFRLPEPSADTLENSLNPDQARQIIEPDHDLNCLILFLKELFFKKKGMFWENQQTPKKHENYPDRYWRKIQRLEDLCSHKFLQVVLDNTCCCSKVHWPLEKGQSNKSDNTLSASTCELVDEYSNSPVSDVQAKNFYFQVKFINCYLREIISFTKNIDIRDWGQSSPFVEMTWCMQSRKQFCREAKVIGTVNSGFQISDIGKLFSLFLIQNLCCGYSKEPSQWDGSFEHPKHIFILMGKKIITILRS